MVFDITRISIFVLTTILGFNALEFGHNNLHWLSDNVGQNVESSSVRHAYNEVSCPFIDCSINSDFKSRNEALASLKTESFHSIEFLTKESTKLM